MTFVVGYRCGTALELHRAFPVDSAEILALAVALCKLESQALVMTLPVDELAHQLQARASELGFGLVGAVDAADYDASLPLGQSIRRAVLRMPAAGTLVILGSGGRHFWDSMQVSASIASARPGYDPIDEASEQRLAELVAWLGSHSVSASLALPNDPDALDFVRLASMSGLGRVSPVMGLLLHEEFGPWVSLRGVLLLEGYPFGAIDAKPSTFDPCTPCSKPCVTACPAEVFDGKGVVDLARCASHRLGGGCDTGCDARRACPVGADARYGADEEAFRHAYSLFAMRRWSSRDPDVQE